MSYSPPNYAPASPFASAGESFSQRGSDFDYGIQDVRIESLRESPARNREFGIVVEAYTCHTESRKAERREYRIHFSNGDKGRAIGPAVYASLCAAFVGEKTKTVTPAVVAAQNAALGPDQPFRGRWVRIQVDKGKVKEDGEFYRDLRVLGPSEQPASWVEDVIGSAQASPLPDASRYGAPGAPPVAPPPSAPIAVAPKYNAAEVWLDFPAGHAGFGHQYNAAGAVRVKA